MSRYVNGKWLAPQSVFNDNWKIAACPVNGPALAAHGRNVAMTWFTVKQEQGQAYSGVLAGCRRHLWRADSCG